MAKVGVEARVTPSGKVALWNPLLTMMQKRQLGEEQGLTSPESPVVHLRGTEIQRSFSMGGRPRRCEASSSSLEERRVSEDI